MADCSFGPRRQGVGLSTASFWGYRQACKREPAPVLIDGVLVPAPLLFVLPSGRTFQRFCWRTDGYRLRQGEWKTCYLLSLFLLYKETSGASVTSSWIYTGLCDHLSRNGGIAVLALSCCVPCYRLSSQHVKFWP